MSTEISIVIEDEDNDGFMSRRNPLLVVLLSLIFGSYAFVYCGRLKRAFLWEAIIWLFTLPLAAICMLYLPSGKSGLALGYIILFTTKIFQIADALLIARKQSSTQSKSYQSLWGYLLLLAAFTGISVLAISSFNRYWCEAFSIPTNSMKPSLLAGDRILVDKLLFSKSNLKKGDIVVFQPPAEGVQQYRGNNIPVSLPKYVKRILAVSGDTLEIVEDKLFVNGILIKENYAIYDSPIDLRKELRNTDLATVPNGHVFLLGDNRWQSFDSRFFGSVPVENLLGKAQLIFWSREYEVKEPQDRWSSPQEIHGDLRWERMGMIVE